MNLIEAHVLCTPGHRTDRGRVTPWLAPDAAGLQVGRGRRATLLASCKLIGSLHPSFVRDGREHNKKIENFHEWWLIQVFADFSNSHKLRATVTCAFMKQSDGYVECCFVLT